VILLRAIVDGDGFPIAVVEHGYRHLASYLEDEIAFGTGEHAQQVLAMIPKVRDGRVSQWEEFSGAHHITVRRTTVTLSCSYRANQPPIDMPLDEFQKSLEQWIAVVGR